MPKFKTFKRECMQSPTHNTLPTISIELDWMANNNPFGCKALLCAELCLQFSLALLRICTSTMETQTGNSHTGIKVSFNWTVISRFVRISHRHVTSYRCDGDFTTDLVYISRARGVMCLTTMYEPVSFMVGWETCGTCKNFCL